MRREAANSFSEPPRDRLMAADAVRRPRCSGPNERAARRLRLASSRVGGGACDVRFRLPESTAARGDEPMRTRQRYRFAAIGSTSRDVRRLTPLRLLLPLHAAVQGQFAPHDARERRVAPRHNEPLRHAAARLRSVDAPRPVDAARRRLAVLLRLPRQQRWRRRQPVALRALFERLRQRCTAR